MGGGESELRMVLLVEVSGSDGSGSCCLFKGAELCPEEVEQFCPPDLRFPATRWDHNLRLEPEAPGLAGQVGLRAPPR